MPDALPTPGLATPPGGNAPVRPMPVLPSGPTAPGTVAPRSAGLQARAPALADLAMKLVKEALRLVEPRSDEEKGLLKALQALSGAFGTPSGDITRGEVKLLGERAAPVSPANPAAFQQLIRNQAAGRLGPRPGAPPPVTPPPPVPAGAAAGG